MLRLANCGFVSGVVGRARTPWGSLTRLASAGLGLVALLSVAQAQDRIKFDFWYGNTGKIAEVVDEECKRFNESQSKYEAACTTQGGYDKAEQNTIAAYRSNKQPTIAQIWDSGTVNFLTSGAIYPADQLVADFNANVPWDDVLPAIRNYFGTSKGILWSFPFNTSTGLFYWNKADWKKIGKTQAPETMEDWFADLRAMKAAGVECGVAVNFDPGQWLEQFSIVHGIPIATLNNGYDGFGAELVFNKTKFADFMKDLKKLLDEGIAQIHTQQTGRETWQAFADQTCASTITPSSLMSLIQAAATPGLEMGMAMIPVYSGFERQNSGVGGASLWVMQGKSKEEYEAAVAFLQFLATPEEAMFFVSSTGYTPVRTSAYEYLKQQGYYDDPTNAGRDLSYASLNHPASSPNARGIRLANFTQVRYELRSELEAAFTGQKDMQAALDAAVERGNQILRRFERTFEGKELP